MKKLRRYFPRLLLVAVVAAVVGTLAFVTPMLAVDSGSMEPTLPKKSRIIIQQQEDYDPGDIITFRADEDKVVTHRLMKITKGGIYTTKGDASLSPDVWDDPLTAKDVMGKVIYMTPITTFDFWRTPRGIGIVLCLLVIATAMRQEDDETKDTPPGKETVSVPHPA